MLTPEQRELRQHGIGASEIAAVCGLNPFSTPMDVWKVKTGLTPEWKGNEATDIGSELEGWIADQYCHRTGEVLLDTAPSDTFIHPEYDWAMATPDRILIGEKLLEIKLVGPNALRYWDDRAADGVPLYVFAQVQWQMFVADYPVAVVCALMGGVAIRWWEFARDDVMLEKMFALAENFWNYNVMGDHPPDPLDAEYLAKKFPKNNGRMLEATEGSRETASKYLTCRALEALEKKDKEKYKNQLIAIIGDHDGIEGVCTYLANKNGKRIFRFIYQEETD